jgi:hypothetical protein
MLIPGRVRVSYNTGSVRHGPNFDTRVRISGVPTNAAVRPTTKGDRSGVLRMVRQVFSSEASEG